MDLKEALLKQNEEHTQSKIKWTTEKMELLADCVVDMLIKYNDKNLLSNTLKNEILPYCIKNGLIK